MITRILSIVSGRGKMIAIGIAVAALIGTLLYGYMKIQSLESTVDARDQRIELIESQYVSLRNQYLSLENDFTEFARQVNDDLEEQRMINQSIRNVNNEYRQRVNDLEESFMYDSDGNRRDWDEIFDERAEALEDIINENTRELRDDFKEVTSDR